MSRLCVLCVFVVPLLAATADDNKADTPKSLRPFLEEFKVPETPVERKEAKIPSAFGAVEAFVARPKTNEALPAVLLLAGLNDWSRLSAREVAGVGYVTLALDLKQGSDRSDERERALAKGVAAVRWLRGRADVLPGQIGVVGWKGTGELAVALSGTTALQACVVCDAPPVVNTGAILALRRTAFLGVFASADHAGRKAIASFRMALKQAHQTSRICMYEKAEAGFMNPASKTFSFDDAEDAWVQMYEFLGKHVEDAGDVPISGQPERFKGTMTIADIMRAVNQPTGVRGRLIGDLGKSPKTMKEWQTIRANAALLVDAGHLLEQHKPPKGPAGHWRHAAHEYTVTAEETVAAADRRDQPAAERGLQRMGQQCAACHKVHR
jgi:dienelactone hydrolase/mono/diheme cytochrome c family protein